MEEMFHFIICMHLLTVELFQNVLVQFVFYYTGMELFNMKKNNNMSMYMLPVIPVFNWYKQLWSEVSGSWMVCQYDRQTLVCQKPKDHLPRRDINVEKLGYYIPSLSGGSSLWSTPNLLV